MIMLNDTYHVAYWGDTVTGDHAGGERHSRCVVLKRGYDSHVHQAAKRASAAEALPCHQGTSINIVHSFAQL